MANANDTTKSRKALLKMQKMIFNIFYIVFSFFADKKIVISFFFAERPLVVKRFSAYRKWSLVSNRKPKQTSGKRRTIILRIVDP